MTDDSTFSPEFERGRQTAETLWRNWTSQPDAPTSRHPDFANGFLDALVELQYRSADVDKEMRRHAETAAESLTSDPFHGVLEIVQNADDVGATRVRLGVRRGRTDELLVMHDGAPIEPKNVIAIQLAFLSTKRDDAKAKGRFGIGLKTLNQLGARLEIHSSPFHFAVEGGVIERVAAIRSIRGIYTTGEPETLFRLPLTGEFDGEALKRWASAKLTLEHLLFLDSVRIFELINLRSGRSEWSVQLDEQRLPNVELDLGQGRWAKIERVRLRDAAASNTWTRYSTDYPVPLELKRTHKKTERTTPLAIAVPEKHPSGLLSAGLPLGMNCELPFALNAQFDPEMSRHSLAHRRWNEWLFDRLADVASAVAVHRFTEKPSTGWASVPLSKEAASDDPWIQSQLRDLVVQVQQQALSRVRVMTDGSPVRLADLVYESENLTGLLSITDQQQLVPEKHPLRQASRDTAGRWRTVLDELDVAIILDARDALALFEWDDAKLGTRPATWFLRLANAALGIGAESELLGSRCILLEDGGRAVPNQGTLLVGEITHGSLAERLGLAQVVSKAYINGPVPEAVAAWLTRNRIVVGEPDALTTLDALTRRTIDPIHLSDDDLILLREVFNRTDDDNRAALGPRVGKAVTIDGYTWQKGKKVPQAVRPAEAYLPNQIAREPRGWSQAAAETEGVCWIDPRYLRVLRAGPEAEGRARRLFVTLGATLYPRVEPRAPAEQFSAIDWASLPATQREAISRLGGGCSHFYGDWVSPDIDRVMHDIALLKINPVRRARARALFETLSRSWERLEDKMTAQAMYHYYSWKTSGTVPATWLARLASEEWLSTKGRRKSAPMRLAIETPLTRLTRGDDRNQYAAELTEEDASSPLIAALGIKGNAPPSELIKELIALRDSRGSELAPAALRELYAALALFCPKSGSLPASVGDVSIADLRRAFSLRPGLILTTQGWKTRDETLTGLPIFKQRRSFVPDSKFLEPLWRVLEIRRPTAEDCIDVLAEIANTGKPPVSSDQAVIVDTLRYLREHADALPTSAKRRLAKLPLWTSDGWRQRPVFASADSRLETALEPHLPIWKPGVVPSTLNPIPSLLGVQILDDNSFKLLRMDTKPAEEFTRVQYLNALRLLNDRLARRSPVVSQSGQWALLENLDIRRAPDLTVQLVLPDRKPIRLQREIHLDYPGTLYLHDDETLGTLDTGEVLSRFFSPDQRELIAYAWLYAWQRAETEGPPADLLELARAEIDDIDPLEALAEAGNRQVGKRIFAGGALKREKHARDGKPPELAVPRELKTFDKFVITEVTYESAPMSKSEQKPVKRRKLRSDVVESQDEPTRDAPRRKAEWTAKDSEQRGFELLATIIQNLGGSVPRDYRAIQNLGADSIDELERFFELKVYTGELPDWIHLEPSQVERAVRAGNDFFLVVIGGIEKGKQTSMRIIANPLKALGWRKSTSVSLSGIQAAGLKIDISDEPSGNG